MAFETIKKFAHDTEKEIENGIEHDATKNYEPSLIGYGNEHLVFESPKHPESVIKINVRSIREAVLWHNEHGGDYEDFEQDENLAGQMDMLVEESDKAHRELREHFGKEHVPKSRYVRMRIPLTKSILNYYRIDDENIPAEISAVAMVQEKVHNLSENSEAVRGSYDDENPSTFAEEVMKRIVHTHDESDTQSFPKIEVLVDGDPKKYEALKNFTAQAISYSNTTGRTLDLAGEDNLVLQHNENDQFDYLLIDALFPATWQKWIERLKNNLSSYLAQPSSYDEEKIRREAISIALSLKYVRFINHLADYFELDEKIEIFDKELHQEEKEALELFIATCKDKWEDERKARNQTE